MEITIAVDRATPSPPEAEEAADLFGPAPAAGTGPRGYVGEGRVPHTLTGDGGAAEALVLTGESALPGSTVRCRPVALYHVLVDGRPRDVVFCVDARDPHAAGAAGPEGASPLPVDAVELAEVLRHLGPQHSWRITGCEGRQAAEAYLDQADRSFRNLVGTLG